MVNRTGNLVHYTPGRGANGDPEIGILDDTL